MGSAPPRPRVMVDATVLVAACGWPRWPYEVLRAGLNGEFRLVLCPYIIEQARRTLLRRFPGNVVYFEELLAYAN